MLNLAVETVTTIPVSLDMITGTSKLIVPVPSFGIITRSSQLTLGIGNALRWSLDPLKQQEIGGTVKGETSVKQGEGIRTV